MEYHWAEDGAAESHELALYPQYIGKTSRSLSLLECLSDSNNFFPRSCSFFHSISVKRIEKDGTGGQTGTQDRLKRVGEDRLKDRTLQTALTKIEEGRPP